MRALLLILALSACSDPLVPGQCAQATILAPNETAEEVRDRLSASTIDRWMGDAECLVVEVYSKGDPLPFPLFYRAN
ncbi:MAG: hypothetical protein AAF389_14795 [Gemmatimonadota bacterium]